MKSLLIIQILSLPFLVYSRRTSAPQEAPDDSIPTPSVPSGDVVPTAVGPTRVSYEGVPAPAPTPTDAVSPSEVRFDRTANRAPARRPAGIGQRQRVRGQNRLPGNLFRPQKDNKGGNNNNSILGNSDNDLKRLRLKRISIGVGIFCILRGGCRRNTNREPVLPIFPRPSPNPPSPTPDDPTGPGPTPAEPTEPGPTPAEPTDPETCTESVTSTLVADESVTLAVLSAGISNVNIVWAGDLDSDLELWNGADPVIAFSGIFNLEQAETVVYNAGNGDMTIFYSGWGANAGDETMTIDVVNTDLILKGYMFEIDGQGTATWTYTAGPDGCP